MLPTMSNVPTFVVRHLLTRVGRHFAVRRPTFVGQHLSVDKSRPTNVGRVTSKCWPTRVGQQMSDDKCRPSVTGLRLAHTHQDPRQTLTHRRCYQYVQWSPNLAHTFTVQLSKPNLCHMSSWLLKAIYTQLWILKPSWTGYHNLQTMLIKQLKKNKTKIRQLKRHEAHVCVWTMHEQILATK